MIHSFIPVMLFLQFCPPYNISTHNVSFYDRLIFIGIFGTVLSCRIMWHSSGPLKYPRKAVLKSS